MEKEKNELDLMPLSEAARLAGYTPEYLNLLSRQGKFKAQKIGRNWYTRQSWLNDFLKQPTEEENIFDKTGKKADGESDEKKYERKIFWSLAVSALAVFPLIFLVASAGKTLWNGQKKASSLYLEYEKYNSQIINENTPEGKVAGEEAEKLSGVNVVLASENYKVSDINLGGDIMILSSDEKGPLEIRNIKSESFLGKNDETKMIISWQTSKLAVSELNYVKSDGQNLQTLKEDSYGFIHSAMVPDLDPGTSYVYSIKVKDRWANEKNSGHFGIYTSRKPVSVFDLISGALDEVFGWAISKK